MLFINALYLLAATAVAGPVLFHLLLRDRPKRQLLPTARFLTDSAPQSYAMHRLKNLLLLILRTAVVALLVLAFARPFFGKAPADESRTAADTSAVFAVDTSLSVGAADRWDAAKGRVRTLVGALPENTPTALLLFNKSADLAVGPTTDRKLVLDELQRMEPTQMAGDLSSAVQAASDLAAGLDAKRKIVYLVSDFQESAVSAVSRVTVQPGVEVVPVQIDDATHANAAIVSAGFTRNAERGKGDVFAVIKNYGGDGLNGTLEVLRDGKTITTAPVKSDPGQPASINVTIDLPIDEESQIELRLDSSDAIAADNIYRFIVEAPKAVPVLVVERTGAVVLGADTRGPPPGANAYLSAALSAMDDSVVPSWLDPDRITADVLTGFPVVLLSGASVTAQQIELLQSYVDLGGSLIIFPQQDQTIGLAELGGTTFDGWDRVKGSGDDYRLVSATLPQGPFALLDQSAQTVLGHPRAVKYLKCSASFPAGVTALAKFDDGSPFLLERKTGDGLVYLFTVALDASSTDFILRAAFAPFLNELIAHAANQVKTKRIFVAGNRVPRRMTTSAQAAVAAFVKPGFVPVTLGKDPLTVAVNIDPVESDLTPADAAKIEALGAQASAVARPAGVVPMNLLEPEKERDHDSPFWKYFLVTALVLLAVESLLASRTTR